MEEGLNDGAVFSRVFSEVIDMRRVDKVFLVDVVVEFALLQDVLLDVISFDDGIRCRVKVEL